MLSEFDLMESDFRKITLLLYQENLSPLACQIGACRLINEAVIKTDPDDLFLNDPMYEGTSLGFYADLIDEYFDPFQPRDIKDLHFVEVKPYQKYKARLLEALEELAFQDFIQIIKKLENGNYETIVTEKLNQYQTIPYRLLT